MTEREQTCAGWDEELSALLDGELDPGQREEVEVHVASCERCSERVEALRAVDARLGEIPLPEISGRLSPPRPEQAPAPPLQRMSDAPARTRSAPPRSAPRRAAWKQVRPLPKSSTSTTGR